MTGTVENKSYKAGVAGPAGRFFYFSFYYFTTVCPWTEELS